MTEERPELEAPGSSGSPGSPEPPEAPEPEAPEAPEPAELDETPGAPGAAESLDGGEAPDVARQPAALSYAERYRGTAWGAPEPAAPGPPPSTRLVVGRRLALGAGLLLALGVVAVVVLLVAANVLRPAGPLLDVPRPPAKVTPTPGIADDPTVLDRFQARLATGRRAYRIEAAVAVVGANRDAEMTIDAQVTGDAWRADIQTTPARGPAREASVVHLNGVTWSRRSPTAGWKQAGLDVADVPDVDPFLAILVRGDVVYLGPVFHGDAWTYHLATRSGWASEATRRVGGQSGRQINAARLDVWVTANGTPIEAVYTDEIGILGTAVRHSYTTSATYRFFDVGEKVRIRRPA
jgi:hypothetical protein